METQPASERLLLARQLAQLVADASDEEVTAAEVLAADGASLTALGLTSLTQLRLIDAVERQFGIDVDLGGDLSFLDTIDGLAGHVIARRAQAPW